MRFFVIVELEGEEHRVIQMAEPLGRWEVGKCPPGACLMFLPLKSHYEFIVDYPVTRVRVGLCQLNLKFPHSFGFFLFFIFNISTPHYLLLQLGDTLVVRIDISDPFHLSRPVTKHGGILTLCVTNVKLGITVEYEAKPMKKREKGGEGVHLVEVLFATPGKYTGMVQFNGYSVQSCHADIRVMKGKGVGFVVKGAKTKHKMKEVKEREPSFNPKFF